jgi:hypothetical protein
VRARDPHCRFPGCSIAAVFCDLDHVRPFPAGPTHLDNLICLCRRHHRLHHLGHLGITGNADQPDGVAFTDRWNRTLPGAGKPVPPTPPLRTAAHAAGLATPTYRHPRGEPIATRAAWFGPPLAS